MTSYCDRSMKTFYFTANYFSRLPHASMFGTHIKEILVQLRPMKTKSNKKTFTLACKVSDLRIVIQLFVD